MPLQLSLFDPAPEEPSGASVPLPAEPPAEPSGGPAGGVLVARGALAAEALLLEELDSLLAAARSEPFLLAKPIRIVVPSRSLRGHLAAAIVRRRGRSVAGVRVQTLHGLAFEVLERSGEMAPRGMAVAGVLAQRFARKEEALQQGLDGLVDGYTAVAGTVRDLLDAGLEPIHAEPFDEALETDGRHVASEVEVRRAQALVRVAARTETALREVGLGRMSTLLRGATEKIEEDPDQALPSRAVFIHGFADATGVATDLLQTLVRKLGARLILDRPADPAAGSLGAAGAEAAFTEKLAERLSLGRGVPAEPAAAPASGALRVASFEAVGADAEVREAAVRVRALLDGGARAEGIGVVARDLGRYRLALRRHFDRLGVPFSGGATRGGLEPAGRRTLAFLELLRRGEDVPADRWLDALASLPATAGRIPLAGVLRVDLRLAFSALGSGRLRDVADLPVDRALPGKTYALPIRQGLRSETAEPTEDSEPGDRERGGTHAARRRVETSHIRRAVRAAGRLRDRIASWPELAPASQHLNRLRDLLLKDLGWDREADESRPVLEALDGLAREVPLEMSLTRDELRLLLAGALKDAGTAELGGYGGGVQVLSVMEARGRTFEHLFVLGLNRDVFPRGVHEDPLLSDDLRRILRRVLPDVPIKRSGFDEERYLFAQLLSASPAVTLSWQVADEEGKPLSPSPLVGRLRLHPEPGRAPSLYAYPAGLAEKDEIAVRPAFEQAVLAALYAPRRRFGAVLPYALEEGRADLAELEDSLAPLSAVAAARLAVLEELDPDRRVPEGRATAAGLGPYYGFVGSLAAALPSEADPRRKDLYVTALEGIAACPWQLFLGRLLQLEPTPDPLEALPGADPLLLGNLVHAALERIVREAAPELWPEGSASGTAATQAGLKERLEREPVLVPWPAAEDLDRWTLEEAEGLLAEEGLFLPGLARALAERIRPLLDAAREVDWAEGDVPVLGAEVEGLLPVYDAAGRIRSVRFKADRVDRLAGRLRWTDYKTGKPLSEKKTEDRRRRDFLERVRAGSHLQGVAYLLAAEGSETDPVGRYLFLRKGLEEREFAVESGDRDFQRVFAGAVKSVLGAWDQGSFFPRLVDPKGNKEPSRCGFCAVSEACLRHDSGSRLRLFEWTDRARSGEGEEGTDVPPPDLAPSESALLGVWRLMEKEESSAARETEDPAPG